MRDKLNSNPILQAAVIGVLLLGTAFFLLSTMGGGGEEEASTPEPATTTETPTLEVGETGASTVSMAAALSSVQGVAAAAPPPPQPVLDAWEANQTIALLFVRNGGIDDGLVRAATDGLGAVPDVATFIVPAAQISRYAAIAEGVGVERTPALVVVSPRDVKPNVPAASVRYGYQSPESVVQAVIDAGYEGRTLGYHP